MIRDAVELSELIETTKDLIEHNSWEITLIRSTWERTPSGGTRPVQPQALDPQTLYFGAVTGDSVMQLRAEGETVISRHVLVGLPGADIKEKDTFSIGTQKFKVVELAPDETYEKRAWVVEYS